MKAKYELRIGLTLDELGELDDQGWQVIRLLMIRPEDESDFRSRSLVDVLLRKGGSHPLSELP